MKKSSALSMLLLALAGTETHAHHSASIYDQEVEGQPPAILRHLGWTEDSVKLDDRVTITGIAGRDARRFAE